MSDAGHKDHGTDGDPIIHLPMTPHTNSAHHEESEPWLISYADLMTLLVGFFVILLSFSSVDQDKLENLRRAVTQQFGGTYEVPFGDLADRLREALSKMGLGDQFIVKTNDQGVEISFFGTVFFNTGSAELKAEAMTLLDKLVPIVKSEAGDFQIVIEGHTDDVPIADGSRYKNNWELSSIRACRVLDEFEIAGFEKLNLTALGFGDARPVVPNRDVDGNAIPVNQSQNRRVVIKLIRRSESTLGVQEEKPTAPTPQDQEKTTNEK